MYRLIILALFVVTILSCGDSEEAQDMSKDQRKTEVSESKTQRIIEGLASKYNARTNWDRDIYYTIQLQEALIGPRPIVFTGYVSDIFREGESSYIRFTKDGFLAQLTLGKVQFTSITLKCDDVKLKKIIKVHKERMADDSETAILQKMRGPSWYAPRYAVVATIDSVTAPVLKITGHSVWDGEVELEYGPSNTYMAEGNCIDFAHIGYLGDDLSKIVR